jgi:BMFP domain-containing protein YqiC
MSPDPKFLDDIARVAGGALNVAGGIKQQIREDIQIRVEEIASKMDLVPREDLDHAMAMIADLQKRIEKLEKQQNLKPKKTTKKTSTKKKK